MASLVEVETYRGTDKDGKEHKVTAEDASAKDIDPDKVQMAINAARGVFNSEIENILKQLEPLIERLDKEMNVTGMNLMEEYTLFTESVNEAKANLSKLNVLEEISEAAVKHHNERQKQYNKEAKEELDAKIKAANAVIDRRNTENSAITNGGVV